MTNLQATALLLALAACAAPSAAQGKAVGGSGPVEPVVARLACETATLRAGAINRLAVVLDLAEGWHVYAPCANDSGMPVEIEPLLPPGFTARRTEGPAPQRHLAPGGLLDHVLEGRVVLPLELDVPAQAAGGPARLRAKVSWMACASACVLGDADLDLSLDVSSADAEPRPGPDAPLLRAARERVPQPLPARDAPLSAEVRDGALRLHAPGAAGLAFYPDADSAGFENLARDGAGDGTELVLRLRPGPRDVRGVAELRWPDARPNALYRLTVSVPTSTQPGRAAPQQPGEVR
jgi:DsbC/DsbD-like thiol-disulfide interchange protein